MYVVDKIMLGFSQTAELPVHLFMLLEEEEGEDRVRTDADETGNPALEHPADAFRLGDICDESDDAVVLIRAHYACFNNVDWGADRRRNESSEERGCEVRRKTVFERRVLQQRPFEPIVCCQLSHGHQDCS